MKPSKSIAMVTAVLTAAFAVPAFAQNGPIALPPLNTPQDENGVDLASGRLIVPQASISIGSPSEGGITYERFARPYLSDLGGTEFRDNYDIFALNYPSFSNAFIVKIGEKSLHYYGTTGSIYVPRFKSGDSVSDVGSGNFLWTDSDGTSINFSANPFLAVGYSGGALIPTARTMPNGEREVFHYKGGYWPVAGSNLLSHSIRLQSVTSNRGYQIIFRYFSDEMSHINFLARKSVTVLNSSEVFCGTHSDECQIPSGVWPKISINYDSYSLPYGVGHKEMVTDALNKTTEYTFRPGQMMSNFGLRTGQYLSEIKRHGETINNTIIQYTSGYDGDRVHAINKGGVTLNYAWTEVLYIDSQGNYEIIELRSEVSSSSGLIRKGWANARNGRLTRITDGVNRTSLYSYGQYDEGAGVTLITNPEGNTVENVVDARGNVTQTIQTPKSGSGLLPIVKTAGFNAACGNPKTCNRPNWIRDALNNQTDFTYATEHGGVLTALGPPPTAGAARPLTINAYVQRSAWIKDATGVLVQSPDPIWLPATTTVCQTAAGSSAPVCDASAQRTVTTFEYGANGTRESLLVKGVAVSSGGTTLRTCYGYDLLNRRISESQPNANLAACP